MLQLNENERISLEEISSIIAPMRDKLSDVKLSFTTHKLGDKSRGVDSSTA